MIMFCLCHYSMVKYTKVQKNVSLYMYFLLASNFLSVVILQRVIFFVSAKYVRAKVQVNY